MRLSEVKQIDWLHGLAIVGIGLILTSPAIIHGVFDAQDLTLYHLKWAKQFSEQFWAFDLYPRWLLEMNAGLGSPTFFFYAPIPYFITSLFHPFFPNDSQSWHPLILSAALALVASGLAAYLWLKTLTGKTAALIAAVFYMALPYHLAVDLYWRFAFAEYWTFVWLPLVLYFSRKIICDRRFTIVLLAVSYALLIMTHLPTLLMFTLIPISYVLFMADPPHRKPALVRLAVAMLLGIGLSAIYWLPAITTQKYVSMSAITEGMYFYGRNFLHFLHKDQFWIYLGIITVVTAALAYGAFRMARQHPIPALRRESRYWMAIATASFLMILPISKPLWDVLPALQRIQFAWRFNTILALATTALVALACSALKKPVVLDKPKLAALLLLAAGLVLAGLQVMPLFINPPFNPRLSTIAVIVPVALLVLGVVCLQRPVDFSGQKSLVAVMLLMTSSLVSSGIVSGYRLLTVPHPSTASNPSMDAAEYRPRWVSKAVFQPDRIRQLGHSTVSIAGGEGTLWIQRWKPREIRLQANAPTPFGLIIHQFYYPGWAAKLGDTQPLAVRPSGPEGLLHLEIPQGSHEITVRLAPRIEERTGQMISAVSAAATVLLALQRRRISQHRLSYPLEVD